MKNDKKMAYWDFYKHFFLQTHSILSYLKENKPKQVFSGQDFCENIQNMLKKMRVARHRISRFFDKFCLFFHIENGRNCTKTLFS